MPPKTKFYTTGETMDTMDRRHWTEVTVATISRLWQLPGEDFEYRVYLAPEVEGLSLAYDDAGLKVITASMGTLRYFRLLLQLNAG